MTVAMQARQGLVHINSQPITVEAGENNKARGELVKEGRAMKKRGRR